MGDVGSGFLGYTFAVLPLFASIVDSRAALLGVLLVWPFVFDPGFTFLRRLRNRENVFAAHRSHLYQRLVIAGQSHRSVAVLYVCLAGVGALASVSLHRADDTSGLAIILVPVVLFTGLRSYVRARERRLVVADHVSSSRTGGQS